jgi:hypothetical protein
VLTHCCGSIEEILPDLIEIGLDVYQSVQPETPTENAAAVVESFLEQAGVSIPLIPF